MKLNIGCNAIPFTKYVNIDNGSFHSKNFKKLKQELIYNQFNFNQINFIAADAKYLPFKNNTFDEIFSNQCIGQYVDLTYEINRVLKPKGILILGIYDNIKKICLDLIRNNFKIISVNIFNGSLIGDDNDISLKIKAIKN